MPRSRRDVLQDRESHQENNAHISAKDISAIIPTFGEEGENAIRAEVWIKKIDSLRENYGWDSKVTMLYAAMRLRGAASFWYETAETSLTGWEAFKEELQANFPDIVSRMEIHDLLKNRKRKADESIEYYFHKTVAIGKRAKLDNETIMEYIINGLDDDTNKGAIKSKQVTTFPDLLREILVVSNKKVTSQETLNQVNNKESSAANGNKEFHRSRSKWRKFNRDKRDRSYVSRHQDNSARTDDGPSGSKSVKCEDNEKTQKDGKKDSRKCFRCHKPGHIAKDCKANFREGVVQELTTQQKNKELHKVVKIEDHEFEGFVDLGSECTTIRKCEVDKRNWEVIEDSILIHGFAGGVCRTLGKIQKIIKIDNFEKRVEIHIIPDDLQKYQMIIGLDVFDDPKIVVIKRWKGLEIRKIEDHSLQILNMRSNDSRQRQMISADMINVGKHVNEQDKSKLVELVNKYRDCFATGIHEIGKTGIEKMKIELSENRVIAYKPYRVAEGHKSQLKKIIQELLDNGIIQRSNSEYASPVILVPKKTEGLRMCVDYRHINAITKRETFPSPNLEEELSSFAGKSVFSNLDLMSGFYQVEIEPDSRKYLAFVVPDGKYEFVRVPFGCTNSPAVFMRVMAKVLDPLNREDISLFMDDILLSSKSVDDAFVLLEKVLVELRKAGMTLNLEKCDFLTTETTYLGHRITKDGVAPGDRNVESIKKFDVPKSFKKVRRFLGLTGFFRKYVKDYAIISAPLRKLLKKDVKKFYWGDEQQSAFEKLRLILTDKPVLAIFNPNARHELHCDGSKKGLGGVLLQIEGDLPPKAVAYFSKALTPTESRYTSYEFETMALVESLKRFYYYLLNRKFTVFTDCRSLEQTKKKRVLNDRVARWWMEIQAFDFDMKYRPGAQMSHADCLSRCMSDEVEDSEGEDSYKISESDSNEEEDKKKVLKMSKEPVDWIVALQLRDETIEEIKNILSGSETVMSDKLKEIKNSYSLKAGKIYKKTDEGLKFYVPKGVRFYVVQAGHDKIGHPAWARTLEGIRENFWFPNMSQFVRKYVNNCIPCSLHKKGPDEEKIHLHVVENKPIPFHTCHIDHAGPYPKTKSRKEYIFGIVDSFTGFTILRAVKSPDAQEAIKVLEDISQIFGVPTILISDRGAAFTSKKFKEFCERNVIKHSLVAAKTPRANGKIERVFRIVGEGLKTMSEGESDKDWEKNLSAIQWAINSLRNRVTDESPQGILFNYRPRNHVGNQLLNAVMLEDENDNDSRRDMVEIRKKVVETAIRKRRNQSDKFNQNRKEPPKYKEKDLVLIRFDPPATGSSRKLLQRFRGPYEVKKILGADRYLVGDTEVTQMTQKPFESVYSAEKLKRFCDPQELGIDDELNET